MEEKDTFYNITVDRRDPYSAINLILTKFRADLTRDFISGVDSEGNVPRGLISKIAQQYNTTSGGVSKYLQRAGLLRITANKRVIK